MKIVGLLGGIASGKSTVARELARLGAIVLDADQMAHHVLENDVQVQARLVEAWGPTILDSSGAINRQRIAELVFGNEASSEENRAFLESLIHPKIRAQCEHRLGEIASRDNQAVVVLDVPLLLEAGWTALCDRLLLVDSSRANRLERASLRDWTPEEFSRREATQMPIEQKRERATNILPNDGSEAELARHIFAFWQEILSEQRKT